MNSTRKVHLVVCAALVTASAAGLAVVAPAQRAAVRAPTARYEVVRSYPHDPDAFTQGLTVSDGVLYESTGLHGKSTVRKVKLESGEVLQVQKVDRQYFGEGIAVWRDRIFHLTYQSGLGFIYDRQTFNRVGTFTYQGEGWGITHDGTRLIMSDGSASLRFLDPATQRETGRVQVRDGAVPVEHLNELEFVQGAVLANVWQTDSIVRIDPASGRVLEWVDFSGLLSPAERAQQPDVLNGIAYDAAADRLFVTGKLWPRLFEVRILR